MGYLMTRKSFYFCNLQGKKNSTWCLRQLRHKFDIEAFLFINERTVRMGTVMISTVMTSNEQVENGWTVGDKQGRLKYMMIFLTIDG